MLKKIIALSVFICILQGLLFWPFAYLTMQSPLILLTTVIILGFDAKILKTNSYPSLWLIFVLLILYLFYIDGIIISAPFILCYFLGIVLFLLPDDYKNYILCQITKWFAVITTISLLAYIFYLHYNFSPFFIINSPWGYSNHANYFFFVKPENMFFVRFSGPFIEPGHMGMFSVFILFANRYDFKNNKWLYPIVIGALFSLSLATYILMPVGFVLLKGIKIKYLFCLLIILFVTHLSITKLWNNGNNVVNFFIYERLKYDEEKGIAGNNRIQFNTEKYYNEMKNDGSIFWGRGNSYYRKMYEKEEIGGAGIKIYLIQYGVIGLLFSLLFYLLIASKHKSHRFSYAFILLISIGFIQRAYPFQIYWLAPFILSLNKFNKKINYVKI